MIIAILAILIIFTVEIYNNIIKSRNKVQESWSQIEVQLNRRADLIPNLVETVKGYAAHENEVFNNVTHARSNLLNADNAHESFKANSDLTSTLKSLFAIAENYPELKANTNFIMLQGQLEEVEDKISYTRQSYNNAVLEYNNLCATVPSNIIAHVFKFKEEKYFKGTTESSTVPNVEF